MRITTPKPQLLKHIQTVEHAVNDRSTLPILSNILLQTKENELVITATDLDISIQCRLPLAQPAEQGAISLPAHRLSTIARELPDDVVTIETKKNHSASLVCGLSSFKINGLPPEDFPGFPTLKENQPSVSLSQAALKSAINQTFYAMSSEETRFILNGALIRVEKDTITVVATDGRRLAAASSPLNETAKETFDVVVPAKTVRELNRLMDAANEDDVMLTPLKDNQLAICFGTIAVITRLIEGQFPAYEKVIPTPSKQNFSAQRQQLVDAVRRVSLMTTITSQAVVFEISSNRLVVLKESAELGSAREELAITFSGGPLTVAFNPGYWLDVLKAIETEDVTIELAGPEKPAVIRQPNFTYVVLPMKLS